MVNYPDTLIRFVKLAVAATLPAMSAHALILYPGDNSANQSAPDADRTDIFNAVARVCNSTGGSTSGSAVYVRGKYLLTANHVTNRSHLTFDGTTFYERDTAFTPVQIGTADLKLIKLIEDPGLPDTALHDSTSGDDVSYTTGFGPNRVRVDVVGTFVGWGRGRDESIDDSDASSTNVWTWGANATLAKRWGTNQIDGAFNFNDGTYSYTSLYTTLDSDAGDDEAGAVTFDSGSGIFVENNGVWTLAGVTTAVSVASSSTFSLNGDLNYFVRIQSVIDDIESAIPDIQAYAGWKIDYSLGDDDTDDSDADGVAQLVEFALGGNPLEPDEDIQPTSQIVEDGGMRYLELSYTRPDYDNGLTYTVKTTSDLNAWPTDSSGVDASPSVIDNGDGTETWTYRRTAAVESTDFAYMRLEVTN